MAHVGGRDYGCLSIIQLKEELGRRNAKKSGRKHELVKRLEDYDKNKDFGRSKVVDSAYKINTPDQAQYRDINSDTQIPKLTMGDINTYLRLFDQKFDDKAKNLYNEKFLLCVRSAAGNDKCFVSARCSAEMKKAVVYRVDLVLDKTGVILETQCECAVGMGPNAHCKHLQCLMYGVVMFGLSGTINVQESKTQVLQSFNHCKKFKGSPLKSSSIQLRSSHGHGTSGINNFVDFDPRPVEYVRQEAYRDHFRNMCVSFQAQHCSTSRALPMPILQTVPPANMYAVCNDHDYLSSHPEDLFLDSMLVTQISDSQIHDIEKNTRGQIHNNRWHEERSIRIQSSHFGKICKATSRTNFEVLAKSLLKHKKSSHPLFPKRSQNPLPSVARPALPTQTVVDSSTTTKQAEIKISTGATPDLPATPEPQRKQTPSSGRVVAPKQGAALSHGRKYESVAIRHYESFMNVTVQKCGIFVSDTDPYLGSSPDGIVNNEYIVEVKCPYVSRDRDINPQTIPYLLQDDACLVLDSNHEYYYQVQGQLFCSGKPFVDFIVYTFIDMKVIRIRRDENFIGRMVANLSSFFTKYFKEALLEKLLYKNSSLTQFEY